MRLLSFSDKMKCSLVINIINVNSHLRPSRIDMSGSFPCFLSRQTCTTDLSSAVHSDNYNQNKAERLVSEQTTFTIIEIKKQLQSKTELYHPIPIQETKEITGSCILSDRLVLTFVPYFVHVQLSSKSVPPTYSLRFGASIFSPPSKVFSEIPTSPLS